MAITLMGMLAALLAGGLRFGTRVWHRGEDQLEALAGVQSVQSLMRRELSQALPLSGGGAGGEPGGGPMLFEGEPSFVRFAGPAPSRLLAGGSYQIVFGLADNDGGRQLVMAWRLLGTAANPDVAAGDGAGDEDAQSDRRRRVVLVDDVEDVAFAYFGPADLDEGPEWTDQWVERTTLPLLVRIMVTFPAGDRRRWPQLVAAPMVEMPLSQ